MAISHNSSRSTYIARIARSSLRQHSFLVLVIASKNCALNAAAAARKKIDGGLTGLSTTSTPRKFDLVSRRNSTAPGSSCFVGKGQEFI